MTAYHNTLMARAGQGEVDYLKSTYSELTKYVDGLKYLIPEDVVNSLEFQLDVMRVLTLIAETLTMNVSLSLPSDLDEKPLVEYVKAQVAMLNEKWSL